MMKPTRPQRCNFKLDAPSDAADDVEPLEVVVGYLPCGTPVVASQWWPDARDLEVLQKGGHVNLLVFGKLHPPVMVHAARDAEVALASVGAVVPEPDKPTNPK